MRPTYSFYDVKSFISNLSLSDLHILEHVVADESDRYVFYELKAIKRVIEIRSILLIRHELRIDFELTF